MLITDRENLKSDIQAMVARYGRDRSSLLPILQDVQKKYKSVFPFAMQVIADELGLHPVEVYSVVTFYSFLTEKPQGKYVIRLCRTISCDMQGKDRIARQLRNDLGIEFGETTADGMFSLEWANCLGMCDQGPALLINDEVHTRVTPDKVHYVLQECRQKFGLHALAGKE